MSLQTLFIAGSTEGLHLEKKPVWIPDQAFSRLNNAYVWRDRVKKREGIQLLGRLRRVFTDINYFLTEASPWTFNLLAVNGYVSTADNANPGQVTTTYPHGLSNGDEVIITGIVGATGYNNVTFTITVVDDTNFTVGADAGAFGVYISGGFWISNRSWSVLEPNAQLQAGSFEIVFGGITFTDAGDGTITSVTPGNSGTINYITGSVTLTHTAGAGVATVLSYAYFPGEPVMGTWQRDILTINNEQTIWWDTKYAYVFSSGNFQEFIAGTTWDASNSDFFWAYNYRGTAASTRLLFVTDFVNDANNPIRYTDGTSWTDFSPAITGTDFIFQAKIILAYYGRLLMFNTWEGTSIGSSANFFNRCRFSQVGSPIAADAFRTDIFGKGGAIDAPTNEAIISATFYKNTLIIGMERSTWQLRYVGDYGTPFIWERISSDFGTESPFSCVLFDQGVASVGDRAIVSSSGTSVSRIDDAIPDIVFNFRNSNQGTQRIQGIRDFQREIVFWNYVDSNVTAEDQVFPNRVLVWNYKNNTFAIFRDNVTSFGIHQPTGDLITWDALDIFWDDEDVTWDDPDGQALFPRVVIGNQQGYVHYYGYTSENDPSLSITAITRDASPLTNPLQLTIPNHTLESGDLIYLTGIDFIDGGSPVATDLNEEIYQVTLIDENIISLLKWDGNNYATFSYTPAFGTGTYVGNGEATLLPKLDVLTKDFNPWQDKGSQIFLSSIAFLLDFVPDGEMTVKLFSNSSLAMEMNLDVGNRNVEQSLPSPYYIPASDYVWHRFYSTLTAQYIRIGMTYDDDLMNDIATHKQAWVLNAMALFARKAGKIPF